MRLVRSLLVCRAAHPRRRSLCALTATPKLASTRENILKYGLSALTSQNINIHKKNNINTSVRIQSYDVSMKRPAEFALTSVFGFGRQKAKSLAAQVGVFGHCPLYKMRESQRAHIRKVVQASCVSYGDPDNAAGAALIKEIEHNIQRLKEIGCYRGIRHRLRLPVRGQRTKTNAKTRKRPGRLR